MAKVLIIDDDKHMTEMLSEIIHRMKHEAVSAVCVKDGLEEILSHPYDVVLLDVHLPDGSGLDILPKVRQIPDSPEVIIMTGFVDPDGAEMAIRNGAWDYIQKADSYQKILFQLKRVLAYRKGLRKKQKTAVVPQISGILGKSANMMQCYDMLAQAANSTINVHLTGETGTGKEVFARAIHNNSDRKDHDFVIVDCAALPATLIESVLFGHCKGAFTGAVARRDGLIAQADGGTLFLDEIGDLPLSFQKVFLRVLQEKSFRPVGDKREKTSDFRLISATNQDIDQMVQDGKFRKDLFFRLRGHMIELPPLRERDGDIRELAIYYVNEFCSQLGIGAKGISPEFIDALNNYGWPGNVRELMKSLEIAVSTARIEPVLFPIHLPVHIRTHLARESVSDPTAGTQWTDNAGVDKFRQLPNLRDLLNETERNYLAYLMETTDGDIKEICRITGLTRSPLYERLKKYRIARKDKA